jgi:hypothetical protein
VDADPGESVADLIELEGFDDGGDELHGGYSPGTEFNPAGNKLQKIAPNEVEAERYAHEIGKSIMAYAKTSPRNKAIAQEMGDFVTDSIFGMALAQQPFLRH